MPTEEAMEEYITIVDEIFPNWADCSKKKNGDTTMSASGSKGPMGPVFSSLMYEEDQGNESEFCDIHVSAWEGAIDDVKKHLAAGVQINIRDSEESTPLHWAVDCGHLDDVEVLVSSNADVSAQDNEGQTALHYAVLCEREDIAVLFFYKWLFCFICLCQQLCRRRPIALDQTRLRPGLTPHPSQNVLIEANHWHTTCISRLAALL